MKKLFTILLLLVAFISVKAADILVNSSGLAGSYTTISAAVQAASPGDRILISPQIIPYQEDSLVIDKDLTLMPYATNTFITFEGSIQLTLDSIANFTLIGFRGDNDFKNLFSVINDTATNSYSVINIIDCMIEDIRMDQPKTSLYLSYSEIDELSFSHGDIIGNQINWMFFGNFDYSSAASALLGNDCSGSSNYTNCILSAPRYFWGQNLYDASIPNIECHLFADYIPFGNVNVLSDTCNIIANYFPYTSSYPLNFFNLDFPVNFSNNYLVGSGVKTRFYFLAPTVKGVNQVINNYMPGDWSHTFNLAYCSNGNNFNFSDITFNSLNNSGEARFNFNATEAGGNSGDYQSLPIIKNSLIAYNTGQGNQCNEQYTGSNGMCDAFYLEIGPSANTNPGYEVSNPSLAHLNLDLTPNTPGPDGGSHAWSNYHGIALLEDGSQINNNATIGDLIQANYNVYHGNVPYSSGNTTITDLQNYKKAGNMPPGSKARITYLNLPTQIFDPANIRVKAKAVHGN